MTGRALSCALVALLAAAPGCKLLSLGVPCERDDNCRDDERCETGLCVRQGVVLAPDGGPLGDAGPTPPACPSVTDPKSKRLVLEEPLVIDSSAELAALADAVVIEGDVRIAPGADLTRVELPELVEVTGNLALDTGDDEVLDPYEASLPCLARVGGDLVLDGDAVASFELPRLLEVGDALTLEDGFATLPLPALTSVAGALVLEDLAVSDFRELSALEEAGALVVLQNLALTSLAGTERLQALPLGLRVQQNEALASLSALDALVSAGGELLIDDNPALPACEAEALRDRLVDGGFRGVVLVAGNDDDASCAWHATELCPPVLGPVTCPADAPDLNLLTDDDVTAAAGITCAANVVIAPGVGAVCLPALAEVSGGLTLGDGNTATRVELPALRHAGTLYGSGTSLTTLSLPRLESVGAVELFSLPLLERVYLPRLQTVAGALRVRDTSTPLLYLPELVDVGGEVEVLRVAAITSADLPSLDDVEGVVRLRENPDLVGAAGLRSLREAGGLEVVLNAALVDFDGIGLEALFANVTIDQNPALVSVDGIDTGLTFNGNLVTVTNNPCLPAEDALAWAEAISPGAHNVANNGTAECP